MKTGHDIQRILEARFGRDEVRASVFGRTRLDRCDIRFADLRHIHAKCAQYRLRARVSILAYRLWQASCEAKATPVARFYGAMEGLMLRRKVADNLRLWYCAHREYHAMRKLYLAKCFELKAGLCGKAA